MSKVTGTALTPTANRVIATAQAKRGYHEGRDPSGNWNNQQMFSPAVPGLEWSQGQAWCATFVSWVALVAKVAGLFPRTASTDVAASWYQQRKQWSTYPAIGAQGFLSHGGNEFHTFIVMAYDDTYVWTVEGNTNDNGSPQGDGVYSLQRRRRDSVIEGYGYPAYPEGIISADPAWASRAPKALPPVPVVGPVAPPASVVKRATFKVTTNNLRSLPVNSNMRGTALATPDASVLLVQEADLDQFKHVLAALPGYAFPDLHIGDNTYDSFVGYDPRVWEHMSTEFTKTYTGRHKISLTRHLCTTVLRHRALGASFTFESWHAVTAGQDAIRVLLRREGLAVVRKSIRKRGDNPLIIGADDNTTANLHPSADIHTAHRIDHEHAWNGRRKSKVTLKRTGSRAVITTSDHNALEVTYEAQVHAA